MKTRLTGKNSNDRWYPNSIESITNHLSEYNYLNKDFTERKYIQSNIAYNIQYIEYLRVTLNELNLSGVLKTQTIKTFIITSLSVIEGFFHIIFVEEKLSKNKINWVETKSSESPHFLVDDKKMKMVSTLYIEEKSCINPNLKFQQLIRAIETSKKIDVDVQFFKDLNHLRRLRNKIHLQDIHIDGKPKTDFSSFWITEYNLCKKCLHTLFTNPIFHGPLFNPKLFDFLSHNSKLVG
jgi:hypothetical protein